MREGRRHRVFCASEADVFDPEAPPGALQRLWTLIQSTWMLDWLLLTKRPERIMENLPPLWGKGWPNVWLGVSAENQEYADKRIGQVLDIPAHIRFASLEPLLGPIELNRTGRHLLGHGSQSQGMNQGLDWIIVGGESGPGARAMDLDWARSLRDQCREAGVPFFFKQVGGLRPDSGGHLLDGIEYYQFPTPTTRLYSKIA